MLHLREIVERYRAQATKFGEPMALADFGLSPEETNRVFSALDEDYHISRFLSFSNMQGREYSVSGNAVTHVRMGEGILELL